MHNATRQAQHNDTQFNIHVTSLTMQHNTRQGITASAQCARSTRDARCAQHPTHNADATQRNAHRAAQRIA
eukprot:7555649-Pyramimonas_sp.AAC.1